MKKVVAVSQIASYNGQQYLNIDLLQGRTERTLFRGPVDTCLLCRWFLENLQNKQCCKDMYGKAIIKGR
ncbi:MAG: hypothetical protein ACLVBP_16430 [Ruminococcus sp.]